MEREHKGTRISTHIDDYCVVDLETTGIFLTSAQIIEVSAIRVRNNQVVDEYSQLVNPGCHIPEAATKVNNITDDMVKDAPMIEDVIDSFLSFIGDDLLLGYNIARFDLNLLYDICLELRSSFLSNNYIDLLYSAKNCLKDISDHRLNTICSHYNLDTLGEHRALKDCYLTKACYDKLYDEFGNRAFEYSQRSSTRTKKNQFTAETMALRELQEVLESIIDDNIVTCEEFNNLKDWMENHRSLQGNYPFDRVYDAMDRVLEDGVVSVDELEDLQLIFSDFVDPVKNNSCTQSLSNLEGKHICVTGEFEYGSRSEVIKLIEDMGGIIDTTVKKTTDYLIVGAMGSDNWKTGNYGGKILKAVQYNEKGSDIKIFEEHFFISEIENHEFSNNIESCMGNNNVSFDMSWIDTTKQIIESTIEKEELPEKSLLLVSNMSRDNQKVTSFSVVVCKPDYPAGVNSNGSSRSPLFNIKETTNNSGTVEVTVNDSLAEILIKLYPELKVKKQSVDVSSAKLFLNIYTPSFPVVMECLIENSLNEFYTKGAGNSFGCCCLYEQCSDAMKCLHVNKLYALGCAYYKNLKVGRIFYGKNKNV